MKFDVNLTSSWSAAKPEVSLDFLKAAAVPIFDVTSGGDSQRTLPISQLVSCRAVLGLV